MIVIVLAIEKKTFIDSLNGWQEEGHDLPYHVDEKRHGEFWLVRMQELLH